MPPENPDNQQVEQSPPTPRRRWTAPLDAVRRITAWAAVNRLRMVFLAGACVLSITAVPIAWLAIFAHASGNKGATLQTALKALDNGAYAEARQLAQNLQESGKLPPEQSAGPVFVLGAAAAYEADSNWSEDRGRYYLPAIRYLKEARDRGFPPAREPEGLYLLGKTLLRSGQIPASRPVLREALKINPRRQTEIHYLLAAAYLNDANPKLPEALEENGLCLSDRSSSPEQRQMGLLQRAQILLALGKIPECLETLDQIPPQAKNCAEAILLRGRILIHEARVLKKDAVQPEHQLKAAQKYLEAVKTLRLAQGNDTLASHVTRKAMYLIGVCFLESGDQRAALNQFSRTCKLFPDTPEAQAATFQEAELSRQLGRNDEALASYRQVLGSIADPENYSNPWITLGELRERTLIAYQHYLSARNFKTSLELTTLLYPVFPRERAIELTAETHHAWGHAFLEEANHLPPSKADPVRRQGRAEMRQSGRAYAQLAQLLAAHRRYPDELWNSAQAYLEGHDYRNAVRVLQEYLKNESRRRHPEALVCLGEAMLAQDQIDGALKAFGDCISLHPRDTAAFRARLLASRAYVEKANLRQADALLQENLNGEFLSPASAEWRESLFDLGRLLHVQRRYEEAIARLEEAVVRYPESPRTLESQYLIADSYRQSGQTLQQDLSQVLVENARMTRAKQAQQLLHTALERFQKLREALVCRQETAELTALEKVILRNCYFASGDLLFNLGQYEEAIKAYLTAINRSQNAPEAMEAYLQVFHAYQRLSKPAEARGALEQAKLILNRMKPELPFNETTNRGPKEWADLLDRLSSS